MNKIFFKFFFNLLIRNKFIIIAIVLNTLLIAIFPIIFLVNKENVNFSFKENALLILLIPMILLIIFVAAGVTIIFIKTKKNNVDLYAYIKPIKNKNIILIKELAIWLLSLHLIIGITLAAIIETIMGLNVYTSFIVWIGLIISVSIMSWVWISLISVFPIFMSFMSSFISVFSFSSIVIIVGVVPFMVQQSKVIETNFNLDDHKNNLLKIYKLNKNNEVTDIKYAIYENPLGKNKNNIDGWKPSNLLSYSPFNILFGLSPSISSNTIFKSVDTKNLVSSNNRFSTSYLAIERKSISDDLFNNNHLVAGFSEKTIFDITTKEKLFNELDNLLLKDKNIQQYKNDDHYWAIQKQELMSRNIWTNSLSNEYKNMILHIVGLDSSNSLLFNVFDQYNIVKNKIDGFYKYLSTKYNHNFSEFIKFIWTNMNVKLNIYSYKTLGNFNDINKYHPSLKSYDELEVADKYDIDFIKNKLFHITTKVDGTIEKIQILNANGIYRDLSDNNIFPDSSTMKTIKDFNHYIDQHSTINNLKEIIKNAKNKISTTETVYPVEFRDNVQNYYVIQNQLDINEHSTIKFQWLYLIGLILIAAGIEYLKINKVMKGDIL